jgi:hypothetical protein
MQATFTMNSPDFREMGRALCELREDPNLDASYVLEYGQKMYLQYFEETKSKPNKIYDKILKEEVTKFSKWKNTPPSSPSIQSNYHATSPVVDPELLPKNQQTIDSTIFIPTHEQIYNEPTGDSISAPTSPATVQPVLSPKAKTNPPTPVINKIHYLKINKVKVPKKKKVVTIFTVCTGYYKTGVKAGSPCGRNAVCDGLCKVHLRAKQKELQKQNDEKVLKSAIKKAKKEKKELTLEEANVLKASGWTQQQFDTLKAKHIYKRRCTGGVFDMELSINYANYNLKIIYEDLLKDFYWLLDTAKVTYNNCQKHRTTDIINSYRQHNGCEGKESYIEFLESFDYAAMEQKLRGNRYCGENPECFNARKVMISECRSTMAQFNAFFTRFNKRTCGLPNVPDLMDKKYFVGYYMKCFKYFTKLVAMEKRVNTAYKGREHLQVIYDADDDLHEMVSEGVIQQEVIEQHLKKLKGRYNKQSYLNKQNERENIVQKDQCSDPLFMDHVPFGLDLVVNQNYMDIAKLLKDIKYSGGYIDISLMALDALKEEEKKKEEEEEKKKKEEEMKRQMEEEMKRQMEEEMENGEEVTNQTQVFNIFEFPFEERPFPLPEKGRFTAKVQEKKPPVSEMQIVSKQPSTRKRRKIITLSKNLIREPIDNLSSDASPEATNNSTSKAIVEANIPKPIVNTNIPKPIVNTNIPKPIVNTTIPKPIVNTNIPKPIVNTNIPKPIVNTNIPKPIVNTNIPKPIVNTNIPKPIVNTNVIKPVVNTNVIKPVVNNNLIYKPVMPLRPAFVTNKSVGTTIVV